MSIYVYVTRRVDPLDETGPKITRDERLRLIADES
jgi:hypothetical protein